MSKPKTPDPPAQVPPLARRQRLVERRAGAEIRDPYRWMESSSPELDRWVRGQQRCTRAVLERAQPRRGLKKRFEQLLAGGSVCVPTPRGGRLFYLRRRAGAELAVLCARDGLDGDERVLLDPAELDEDGAVSLRAVFVSRDGQFALCQLADRATSRGALRVVDVVAGKLLDDVIPAASQPLAQTRPGVNAAQWAPSGDGFYYTRHGTAAEPRYQQWLHYHRLGDDWRDDELLFGSTLAKEQTPYPFLSADGRWLAVQVLNLSGRTPAAELFLCDLTARARGFEPVITGIDALFAPRWHRGALYLHTNLEAPRGRIVRIPPERAGQGIDAFETVLSESEQVIGAWIPLADRLFVELIDNAASRLSAFGLDGSSLGEIALPAPGRVSALEGEPEGRGLWFSFSSFVVPDTVYRADTRSLRAEPWMAPPVPFAADSFVLKQIWFESADRAPVPMFVVHRKDIIRDGARPTVLHGYGGFNEVKSPAYDPGVIPLLEAGGVYALANVRGGGEFGEVWHQAGMRERKQNTFDDFIAAARCLIDTGYTASARLGCYGWSNGGLLVNAVAQQRPELWRAAVAGAPVTDLARFHLAGGRHWLAEYGCPDDPEDLRALLRLSPYHALPERIDAPALLLFVPAEDDRVAPWHGYKMLARWQAANRGRRPILLRVEPAAGHQGGATTSRRVERYTDIWTFLFSELNVSTTGD